MPVRRLVCLPFLLLAGPAVGAGSSAPIDEDSLFGDEAGVILDSSAVTGTSRADSASSDGSPGIRAGGEVSMNSSMVFPNSSFRNLDDYEFASPTHKSMSVGTLLLDARSQDGTKAFAAIEGRYLSDSASTSLHLRELFVDLDFRKRLYLRAGKQLVRWGTCYLWNPSDLINIDRISFIERLGHLDGTFGLRAHLPIGTRANLYAFLDGEDADNAREVKVSVKGEVVLGGSELSLSSWVRHDLDPVYAGSFSTGYIGWELAGEAAIFPHGFLIRFKERGDTIHSVPSSAWTPRISLSLARNFDFLAINDRIRVQSEFYYNGHGYGGNPLADGRDLPWSAEVDLPDGYRAVSGDKATWLALHGRLHPYALGRYYAALYTAISHLFVSQLSLACNGIMNVTDRSSMMMAELTYTTLHGLALQFALVGVDGTSRSEFAYEGQGAMLISTIHYPF